MDLLPISLRLLELRVGNSRQDTRGDLCNNIGRCIVCRNGLIVEHHDCNRRVEVAAADRAAQKDEAGQGRRDCQPVAGRHDN